MVTADPAAVSHRRIQWSGRTECGPVRPHNEDAFIGLQFDSREVHHLGATGEGLTSLQDYVFAVSDGMGGALAGEHASRIAVQEITRLLPRFYRHSDAQLEKEYAAVMEELFGKIHKSLVHLGRCYQECRGMEATLSLCWFTKTKMFFGHIGDCRIYRLSECPSSIEQLSEDDTHVGWLFRNGKINEREAKTHPRRKLLQKALGGAHQFVSPLVGSLACQPGDKFLICSDGLVEAFYNEQLCDFFRSPEYSSAAGHPARLLVKEAVSRCGQDNSTAVIVEIS
jgi:serine/threonine protein phosphatase PrpC